MLTAPAAADTTYLELLPSPDVAELAKLHENIFRNVRDAACSGPPAAPIRQPSKR